MLDDTLVLIIAQREERRALLRTIAQRYVVLLNQARAGSLLEPVGVSGRRGAGSVQILVQADAVQHGITLCVIAPVEVISQAVTVGVQAVVHVCTPQYLAVLLGIGGQKPAPAANVCKSGFGDCKGLSNYMRAMLKVVGIPSNYVTISTTNRQLLKDFASVGQMNHVILQVPLQGDTLWLECTNPQLPMGYVHEDIAGHNAIEVSEAGGRLVQLPVYADSTNLMHSKIHIQLDLKGAADVSLLQDFHNWQYEHYIPLLKMDEKDRHKTLQRMIRVPQAEIGRMDVREDGATITVDAEIKSQRYATTTGQRLFVPVCPIHNGYSTPPALPNRQEDIYLESGYLDKDEITLTIPEGYEIEAMPKDQTVEQPFGTFSFTVKRDGSEVRIQNSLLMKSGTYDKSQYPQFIDFMKKISGIYSQKIVLKKQDS